MDLGQATDYSALCVIEEASLWCGPEVDFAGWGVFVPPELEDAGWVSPSLLSPRSAQGVATINRELGRPPHPPLYLRHLERYELGTPYPEVIARVIRLLTRHPIRSHLESTRLIVDATGVGRPVVDSFRAQGVHPVSVLIHGGDSVTAEAPGPEILNLRVPKRDLVAAVQTTLQSRRLQIAAGLPLARRTAQGVTELSGSRLIRARHTILLAIGEKVIMMIWSWPRRSPAGIGRSRTS